MVCLTFGAVRAVGEGNSRLGKRCREGYIKPQNSLKKFL